MGLKSPGVGVMVTKQLSIAIAISVFIGSGIAFKTFAAAPASATRIDFDQVFADATHSRASLNTSIGRARVIAWTSGRFCRRLHCSPIASH